MKTGKLSKTLLVTALLLSLLMSLFPGFGMLSAGATEDGWDYSFEVTPSNAAGQFADQGTTFDGFEVYHWDHTSNLYSTFKDAELSNQVGPLPVDATTMRTTYEDGEQTKYKGYLDFSSELLPNNTSNRKTAAMIYTAAPLAGDFEMEVTTVWSGKVIAGNRAIAIMQKDGDDFKFSLNGDDAKGLAVSLSDRDDFRLMVGGAIQPITAARTNEATVGSTTAKTPASWDCGIISSADACVRTSRLQNLAVHQGGVMTYSIEKGDLITYHIEVKDDQLFVWITDDPDSVLSVTLTEEYEGGYLAFVGQNNERGYGETDVPLVSIKWNDLGKSEKTEWTYQVERNGDNASTSAAYIKNEDIQRDFKIYRYDAPRNGNAAAGAAVLDGVFPHVVDATTTTTQGSLGPRLSNDGGYMDINFVGTRTNGWPTGSGDYYWGKENSRNSGIYGVMTHYKKVKDFYLEFDMLSISSMNYACGIFVAPAGEFPVDLGSETTANDKGLAIGVNNTDGAVNVCVTGTIGTAGRQINTTGGNQAKAYDPYRKNGKNRQSAALGTFEIAEEDRIPTYNGKGYMGHIILCIEAKGGVLSIWNKDNPRQVLMVGLNENWNGGNVSYYTTCTGNSAFVSMTLKTKSEEAGSEWAFESTMDGRFGSLAAVENLFGGANYLNFNNANIRNDLVPLFDQYMSTKLDYYYDDGSTVTQQFMSRDPATGACATVSGRGYYTSAAYVNAQNYVRFMPSLTPSAKSGYGSMVPKMASGSDDNLVYLYGSDFVAETSFRFDYDAINGKGLFGFRMGSPGDFTSGIGAYIKATRNALTLEQDGESTVLVNYNPDNTVFDTKKHIELNLHVEASGDQLTGYVQFGREQLPFSATLTYQEAGYFAVGATGDRMEISLLNMNLVEPKKAAPAAELADQISVCRANSERPGQYKYLVTVKPEQGKSIKVGSFIATDANENKYLPIRVGFQDEENLQSEVCAVYSAEDLVISAEMYDSAVETVPNFDKIGTQVNPDSEEINGGLRFVYRADIRKEGDGYFMTVNGAKKKVVDFGALIALESVAKNLPGGELTYENRSQPYVANKSIMQDAIFYDVSNSYVDFSVQIVGLKGVDNGTSTPITARAYVLLEGESEPFYTEAYTTTYEERA